nr:MAG TPA: hypothetical protein [Caudoviricetes sp.]
MFQPYNSPFLRTRHGGACKYIIGRRKEKKQ